MSLRDRLRQAVADGRAEPLELALADWALRHGGDPPTALAMACCARAVADGHSCLELSRAPPAVPGEAPYCAEAELLEALQASPLVGVPGAVRPLILDGPHLYLQRYHDYETRLAARLAERLQAPAGAVDTAPLQRDGGLFDYAWVTPGDTHWQAVAAFVAWRHRLAVISGGPGTGKTYTVLRLMHLLIAAALRHGQPAPLIRLAAPTGKAAARMLESVHAGLAQLQPDAAVQAHLPRQATTLHRLVGIGPNSTRPRHDPDNPLAADVVIVDEASMVDLPMMTKLIEALPGHARLVLLGDRYQLASVESGSVLAELCDAAGINAFGAAQREAAGRLLAGAPDAAPAGPLADHVVTLQTSHRFRADSGIGRLAAAINAGQADAALAIVGEAEEIRWLESTAAGPAAGLMAELADHFAGLAGAESAAAALALLQQRCLLCAMRRGPWGSQTLNRKITAELARRQGFDAAAAWYHGRPVMVTRNDYRAGLYNGDIGIALRAGDAPLRVWFRTEQGLRAFLPTALPEHDSVYAMTVHKSQGSEFDRVSLVLPPEDHPLLSRELLYTGLTRAREAVDLCASQASLRAAVARRTRRDSGLAERISALVQDAAPLP